MPVYSLTELNQHLRETLENEYPEAIWITAEIAQLQVNALSGHCYLELSEGLSKAKAMIWKKTFDVLSRKFQIQTGRMLQKGILIQVLVKVEFNIQYGLSLVIWDLDTEFSLGELAKKKAEVLRMLENENLLNRNSQTNLKEIVQDFAVISSPTSAGFQDFITHLKENLFGYSFGFQLFSAQMQGSEAAASIESAFLEIAQSKIPFEAVILIRGGGSNIDLQVFDTYEIASSIAHCQIPVLTGIGHERDDSVADQVAYQKFKTPTAVADFLINKLVNAEEMVKEWETEITRRLQWQWQKQWDDYQKNIKECFFDFQKRLYYHEKEKSFWIQKLWQKAGFQLQKEQEKLAQVEMEIFQLNPLAILNKGYAILHQDRKRLHALQEANTQSPISITMKDGKETFRFSKS